MFIAPILTLVWAVVLFFATCTFDPPTVLTFKINSAPNFHDLLITSDIQPTDMGYLLSKLGHFTGFGLLFALLIYWLRNFRRAFILCGSYAALTEILQLFFYRDGRFFDMGIDLAGMLLASFLLKIILKKTSSKTKIPFKRR